MSSNRIQHATQMASSHFLIFFFLLFVFLSLFSPSVSYSSVATLSDDPYASQDKVNLSLYYESLCPYSARFILRYLEVAVTTDLVNIINLRIVPWGNAELEEPSKTIVCQHGEDECYLNTVEVCAINIWPDLFTYYNFTRCVGAQILDDDSQASSEDASSRVSASKHSDEAESTWKSCTTQLKLDENLITECLTDGTGRKLELQYGEETAQLNPPKEFVPWVVVNGQPIREDYMNYIRYVCEAYKGKQKPTACTPTLSLSSTKKQSKSIPTVSFSIKPKRASAEN